MKKALTASKKAQAAFEALSDSNKRRHLLSVEAAKSDETRQRRTRKNVADLAEGNG